ncbi:expressed unknown protein [Seminavis robusta]|uniref:Uncharacterized protein n=1 Tax=Seminavis robusta TaxID=568900 RepID=A0A9N8D8Q2_9STRA|nr:expressed unknown protein [Seminavis robusta]|eukprot:Sro39_g024130.1 n/a (291) ;mRNA; r:72446-73318
MTTVTSSSRLLSLALVLLVQTLTLRPVDAAICHICGDSGNDLMQYPNIVLANVGKTCNDISIDVAVANPDPNAQSCIAAQNMWRGRCCNPNQRPAGVDRANAGLPPQNIPAVPHSGPHPICNVCRDGDFPYDTSMVLNFLYMGVGTCVQYFILGKRGAIEPHMCAPVQFFSYEPCACGEHNPYFNPNHPRNQGAQQAPGNTNSNANGNAGGNANGRTNGDSNGSSNGSSGGNGVNHQKTPDSDASKNGQKMGDSMGGAGGQSHGGRRRGLKGSKTRPVKVDEDVVIKIEV